MALRIAPFALTALAVLGALTTSVVHARRQKARVLGSRTGVGAPEFGPARELSRTALVDGVLMRWEEHRPPVTEELPVVMVHGIPTNPREWRYVIPHLTAAGIPCFAWELVGFGYSIDEGLDRDISIPAQSDHLASWLRSQGIERAVFAAHDVGGGVVQGLLLRHPELFGGLVLVDVVAFENWPVGAVKVARAMRGLIQRLPPALVKPVFRLGIRHLGHDDPAREAEAVALLWQPYRRATGPAGFANQLEHARTEDTVRIGEQLPRNPAFPVRVVWGEHDPLGVSSAERLAETLRASSPRVIAGGRHFNPEDHPEVVAREILTVLREARP